MRGRILKGVGGYYTILGSDSNTYTLKARGRFRLDDVSPIPGDFVEFEPREDGAHSSIDEIIERKNSLTRPSVANIDLVIAVVSAAVPEPDYLLLDRLCANAVYSDIGVIALMNKTDIADAEVANAFVSEYGAFNPICCSGKTGEGLDLLKAAMEGKACCFAGQSGVGKSSIINYILPGYELETGSLSRKTDRGRHTTRHAELLLVGDGETLVVDTPGFSLLELPAMEPEELSGLYPEYEEYLGRCKFRGCMHDSEPSCAVKNAVERGDIAAGRWQRYRLLLAEAREKWSKRYE